MQTNQAEIRPYKAVSVRFRYLGYGPDGRPARGPGIGPSYRSGRVRGIGRGIQPYHSPLRPRPGCSGVADHTPLGEPFKSKAQQRFAFGTGQPWALKWAHATPNIKKLPQRVKKKSNEGNSSTQMGQLMRNRATREDDGSGALAVLKKGRAPSGGKHPDMHERDFDKNVGGGVDRDKIPAKDFAGSGRSFPIVTKADVSDALQSLGRTNQNRAKVKAKIHAIAKRKGFEAEKEADVSIPSTFGRARFVESF